MDASANEGVIRGKAVKVGNDITSDIIIPEKYVEIKDQKVLGDRCFEGISEDFSPYFPQNGIIVAGKNFGKGSNRDYPCIAIMNMGAKAVVAESFSRTFYRNGSNLGLILVECEGCSKKIKRRDMIEINIPEGKITIEGSGAILKTKPIFTPELRQKLLFGKITAEDEQSAQSGQEEGKSDASDSEETRNAEGDASAGKINSDAYDALFRDDYGYDSAMMGFKKFGIKTKRRLEQEALAKAHGVEIKEEATVPVTSDAIEYEVREDFSIGNNNPAKTASVPMPKQMTLPKDLARKFANMTDEEFATLEAEREVEAKRREEERRLEEEGDPNEFENETEIFESEDNAETAEPEILKMAPDEEEAIGDSDNGTQIDDPDVLEEPETILEPESEAIEQSAETEPKSDVEAEADVEIGPEPKPESEPEAESEAESESDPKSTEPEIEPIEPGPGPVVEDKQLEPEVEPEAEPIEPEFDLIEPEPELIEPAIEPIEPESLQQEAEADELKTEAGTISEPASKPGAPSAGNAKSKGKSGKSKAKKKSKKKK